MIHVATADAYVVGQLPRIEDSADDDYASMDGELRALARLEQVAEDARDFAAHAKAPNTLKAYRIALGGFFRVVRAAPPRVSARRAADNGFIVVAGGSATRNVVGALWSRLKGHSRSNRAQ